MPSAATTSQLGALLVSVASPARNGYAPSGPSARAGEANEPELPATQLTFHCCVGRLSRLVRYQGESDTSVSSTHPGAPPGKAHTYACTLPTMVDHWSDAAERPLPPSLPLYAAKMRRTFVFARWRAPGHGLHVETILRPPKTRKLH